MYNKTSTNVRKMQNNVALAARAIFIHEGNSFVTLMRTKKTETPTYMVSFGSIAMSNLFNVFLCSHAICLYLIVFYLSLLITQVESCYSISKDGKVNTMLLPL